MLRLAVQCVRPHQAHMCVRSAYAGSRNVHDHVATPGRNVHHDVGGSPALLSTALPKDHPNQRWELECHALFACLAKDGHISTDELRRGVEELPLIAHEEWGYYERWSASMFAVLCERGAITAHEVEQEFLGDGDPVHVARDVASSSGSPSSSHECLSTESSKLPRFAIGQTVVVKSELLRRTRWRAPHLRTPGYIFGATGVVERVCGAFADPSILSYGVSRAVAKEEFLYRVRFMQKDVWPELHSESMDTLDVEIYESWLHPSLPTDKAGFQDHVSPHIFDHGAEAHEHEHSHDHDHDRSHDRHEHSHSHGIDQDSYGHDHSHVHSARPDIEATAVAKEGPSPPGAVLHSALLEVALKRGFVTRERLRATIEALETAGAELPGARLVARAWVDPEFAVRLSTDAAAAARELGIEASNPNAPTVLTVVANEV